MATYKYQSLDQSNNEIRLFAIQPATNYTDNVKIDISISSLDNAPKYFALSYVCGDQLQREPLEAHGSYLSVTKSLHSALLYLRQLIAGKAILLFWADAVCIRQDDNNEKSQQILCMDRIFSAAQQVIVWLGPGSVQSDLAMDLLDIWCSAPKDSDTFDVTQFITVHPNAFDQELWSAAEIFFRHEWWERIWTYQEAVLARSLMFIWGRKQLRFGQLHSALNMWNVLRNSPQRLGVSENQYAKLLIPPLDTATMLHFHWLVRRHKEQYQTFFSGYKHFDIQGLQEHLHDRKATDDRDKLYAILGVVEQLGFEVKPDYGKPTAEVYIEFAASHIVSRSSLAMLSMSGIGIVSDGLSLASRYPSWAPDFRASSRWPLNLRHSARDLHDQSRSMLSVEIRDRILHVNGIEYGIVSTALPPANEMKDNWEVFILQHKICHPTGTPKLQTLFRTLTRDISDSRRSSTLDIHPANPDFWDHVVGFVWFLASTISRYPSIQSELKDLLADANETETDEINCSPSAELTHSDEQLEKQRLLEDRLYISFLGKGDHELRPQSPQTFFDLSMEQRRHLGYKFVYERARNIRDVNFFITANGYMGLGPEKMQAGDRLCFLFGAISPFLLRPAGSFFEHVGACYVYGLMAGELFDHVRDGKYEVQKFMIQ